MRVAAKLPGSCPGSGGLGVGGVECHGRESLSATLAAPHRRVGGSLQARGCDWLRPMGRACRADRGGVERGWSRYASTRPAMMLERLRSHQRLVGRCQGTRLSSVAIAPGYPVEAGRREYWLRRAASWTLNSRTPAAAACPPAKVAMLCRRRWPRGSTMSRADVRQARAFGRSWAGNSTRQRCGRITPCQALCE